MNTQDQDALRWQLQGLRRDVSPQADLWPGIAARIASTPQQQAVAMAPPVNRRRLVPWAMAASVLLAAGFIWQLLPAANQGAVSPNTIAVTSVVMVTPMAAPAHAARRSPSEAPARIGVKIERTLRLTLGRNR